MEQRQGEMLKKIEAINELSTTPLDHLFVGNATAKLLEFLVKSKDFDCSLSDMIRGAEVSSKTIERDIPKLEKLGIIQFSRPIGKAKLYKVNKESPIVQYLSKFMLSIATVRNYYELKKQGLEEQAKQLIEGKGYFPSK
jgi:DeoR/GlpR family transcriptional regulator of sugar metabolism